jgi:hypothetical protein
MEEQTQAQEPVSISDRISNYLASEEPPEQGTQSLEPAETPSEQIAEEPAEEQQAAPAEEEEFEFTWNGEQVKKKKSEAIELARQGFDYTQKTQQLADARRKFEADAQALQQSYAMQQALGDNLMEVKALDRQIEQYKGVNWHQLAESDPVEYLKLNQSYRDLKEAREAKAQELQGMSMQFQHAQQQHMSQVLQRESEALGNKIPAFAGEKRGETVQAVRSYLIDSGFSEAEVAGVVDHRAVSMAYKAMMWDKQQQAKPAEKKVQNLPKPVKPGAAQPPGAAQQEQYKKMRQELKRTGKVPKGLLQRFL